MASNTTAKIMFGTIWLLQCCGAKEYVVGGAFGKWDVPSRSKVNYTLWAFYNVFWVGDSLRFVYNNASHSVLQVHRESYEECTYRGTLANYSGGVTVIPLTRAGTYYFVCGVTDHCKHGQKLSISVLEEFKSVGAPLISPSSYSSAPASINLPTDSASALCTSQVNYFVMLVSIAAILFF